MRKKIFYILGGIILLLLLVGLIFLLRFFTSVFQEKNQFPTTSSKGPPIVTNSNTASNYSDLNNANEEKKKNSLEANEVKNYLESFWQTVSILVDATNKKDEWVNFANEQTGLSFEYPAIFKADTNGEFQYVKSVGTNYFFYSVDSNYLLYVQDITEKNYQDKQATIKDCEACIGFWVRIPELVDKSNSFLSWDEIKKRCLDIKGSDTKSLIKQCEIVKIGSEEALLSLAGGTPNDDFYYWNLVIHKTDQHYLYLSLASSWWPSNFLFEEETKDNNNFASRIKLYRQVFLNGFIKDLFDQIVSTVKLN